MIAKSILAAATLAATLTFGSSAHAIVVLPAPTPAPVVYGAANPWPVWALGGCVISIMISAADASVRQNRELTVQEAWSCGVLYWFNPPKQRVVRRVRR